MHTWSPEITCLPNLRAHDYPLLSLQPWRLSYHRPRFYPDIMLPNTSRMQGFSRNAAPLLSTESDIAPSYTVCKDMAECCYREVTEDRVVWWKDVTCTKSQVICRNLIRSLQITPCNNMDLNVATTSSGMCVESMTMTPIDSEATTISQYEKTKLN